MADDRTVINIEDAQKAVEALLPHKVSEVICVGCGFRWIAVRPIGTKLKDLECRNCGKGRVIETGEELME